MNENIITLNFANILTILLIASIGFAALGLAQKIYHQNRMA